jgi:hypothetical protein
MSALSAFSRANQAYPPPSRISETLTGHVWPNQISQRLSSGSDISNPQAGFQRGGLDMSDHRPRHVRVSGTPTTIFGCLGKTRPSGFKNWTIWFLRFKAPGQTLPLHDFSHFSLSLTHSRTTVRATPRPPFGDSLVPPWNLGVLGWNQLQRIGVSVPPTDFPHLKVFSPNPLSLCPMDEFDIP